MIRAVLEVYTHPRVAWRHVGETTVRGWRPWECWEPYNVYSSEKAGFIRHRYEVPTPLMVTPCDHKNLVYGVSRKTLHEWRWCGDCGDKLRDKL